MIALLAVAPLRRPAGLAATAPVPPPRPVRAARLAPRRGRLQHPRQPGRSDHPAATMGMITAASPVLMAVCDRLGGVRPGRAGPPGLLLACTG
ncbi:hypothetical protein LT493_32830 [Streptomyces tricolor]|nr:hypothetical protein [Streptomyces tricolor]